MVVRNIGGRAAKGFSFQFLDVMVPGLSVGFPNRIGCRTLPLLVIFILRNLYKLVSLDGNSECQLYLMLVSSLLAYMA